MVCHAGTSPVCAAQYLLQKRYTHTASPMARPTLQSARVDEAVIACSDRVIGCRKKKRVPQRSWHFTIFCTRQRSHEKRGSTAAMRQRVRAARPAKSTTSIRRLGTGNSNDVRPVAQGARSVNRSSEVSPNRPVASRTRARPQGGRKLSSNPTAPAGGAGTAGAGIPGEGERVCSSCGKGGPGTYTLHAGKSYHIGCLKCAGKCGTALQPGQTLKVVNDELYCGPCHMRLFVKTCVLCHKKIVYVVGVGVLLAASLCS